MKKIVSYLISIIIVCSIISVSAYEVSDYKASVIDYLAENTETPSIGSIGGDWTVFAMARSGYDNDEFYESYYNIVKARLEENESEYIDNVSTDNSRVIIALTAAGYDASDIDGYNLLAPLSDFDYIVAQGINGAVYALIALDTKPYELPENSVNSREALIEYILSRQTTDGGWTNLGNKGDVDMTAMAILALVPYYESSAGVADAIEKGIEFLSASQESDGGYSSWKTKNIESAAQVLCMMSAMNISVDDERFVKDGNTVIDSMNAFYDEETGAFRHLLNGNADRMASEQVAYALVAYDRYINGLNRLYDMSDVEIKTELEEFIEEEPIFGDEEEIIFDEPTMTPSPSPTPIPTASPIPVEFDDIYDSEYNNEIISLAGRGIINGKSKETFDPYTTMNRAEFAAIIVKALNLSGGIKSFDDVSKSDWFYDYVCTAYASGIIKGVSNTEFNPYGTITRDEAASMCARAAVMYGAELDLNKNEITDILSQFDDYTDVSEWAIKEVAFCYKHSILRNDVMEIKPSEKIKRDEVAYMIYNLLGM